jgi:NAD(P)-dependent dehydrogenase (short-subunit alcohol dehydrogenase family)
MTSLAIITGASRGIGLATATHFASAGYTVFNLSRTNCPAEGVTNYACDLSDSFRIREVADKLDLRPYKKISLIHNAAITRKDNYRTAAEKDFMEVLKVNVLAPQILNQCLIPRLPGQSSVIFVGSTLSETGASESLSYTTSKHALAGMMKATCQDLAGKNIHTCLVCPGFTDTQMLKDVLGTDESTWEAVRKMVLFGRLIEPAEIAALVFFCANNPSINGSVLHANLGQR